MYRYDLRDDQWTTITEVFTVPESAADPNTGLAPVVVTVWNSNTAFAPVSEMHFDNFEVRKVLKVTTQLTNASLQKQIAGVVKGQDYVNTVVPTPGFEITQVVVKMGGVTEVKERVLHISDPMDNHFLHFRASDRADFGAADEEDDDQNDGCHIERKRNFSFHREGSFLRTVPGSRWPMQGLRRRKLH